MKSWKNFTKEWRYFGIVLYTYSQTTLLTFVDNVGKISSNIGKVSSIYGRTMIPHVLYDVRPPDMRTNRRSTWMIWALFKNITDSIFSSLTPSTRGRAISSRASIKRNFVFVRMLVTYVWYKRILSRSWWQKRSGSKMLQHLVNYKFERDLKSNLYWISIKQLRIPRRITKLMKKR